MIIYTVKNFFKRKQIIVSSKEDVNNIFTDCLSNVKIISEYHMRNILISINEN